MKSAAPPADKEGAPGDDIQPAALSRRRERRRAAHLVNYYAREDELDAELKDESDDEEKPEEGTTSQKRKRRAPGAKPHASKICPGCGRTVGNASQACKHCDYTFTAGRKTREKKVEKQRQFVEEREADGERVLDKVLARRPTRSGDTGGLLGCVVSPVDEKFAFEYLVKFKGVAAVHSEWLCVERIGQMGKRSKQIFNRYVQKRVDDEEWVVDEEVSSITQVVDRIVDVRVGEREQQSTDDEDEEEDEIPQAQHAAEEGASADAEQQVEAADESSAAAHAPDPAERGMTGAPDEPYTGGMRRSSKKLGPLAMLNDAKERHKKRLDKWEPIERCLQVIKHLSAMPEAEPFLEPVDTATLPDYLEIVSKPMDLGTIEKRLKSGSHYAEGDVEAVIKDVRLIWANCRAYNESGSSIWRAAVVLGMASDRLFEAWVTAAQDDEVERTAERALEPWASGCRGCGLRRGANDEELLVLCDHCDAEYHSDCRSCDSVKRAVSAIVGGSDRVWRLVESAATAADDDKTTWHCCVCLARGIRAKVRGVASARVEDAYRKTIRRAWRREKRLAGAPPKRSLCVEYLVKWADCSYKECTWETKETLLDRTKVAPGADLAICRFERDYPAHLQRAKAEMERRHKVARSRQHERAHEYFDDWRRASAVLADGPEERLVRAVLMPGSDVLQTAQRALVRPGRAPPSELDDARAILTAQLGCFALLRLGRQPPNELLRLCGPATYARCLSARAPPPVALAVTATVHCASRGSVSVASELGAARLGEYDAILPKAANGAVGLHLKHAKTDDVSPSLWVAKVPCDLQSPCAGVVGACDAVIACQGELVDGDARVPVAHRFAATVSTVRSAPLFVHCRFRRADMHANRDAAQSAIDQLRRVMTESAGQAAGLTLQRLMEFMPSAAIMSSLASLADRRVYTTQDLFGWTGVAIDATVLPGGWRAGNRFYPSALEAAASLDRSERKELGDAAPSPRCFPGGVPGRARATPSALRTGPVSDWALSRATTDAFCEVPEVSATGTKRLRASERLAKVAGLLGGGDAESMADGAEPPPDMFGVDVMTPEPVRPDPGRKLRDYQERGVSWLIECRERRRGSILADEMGLGKTAQICVYLQRLCLTSQDRPCIIIAPLSTIGHWSRELDVWTSLEVCCYHDHGRDARDLRRHFEWWPRDETTNIPVKDAKKTRFDALVTTYDELIRDADELCSVSWAACVVDEAHRLKNEKGRLLESVQVVLSLGARQRPYQHRVLLTGTPLQNDTKELWTLLNFIQHDAGVFARGEARRDFDAKFGQMETAEQVRELQAEIAPHLLRRVKEDVAKDIPIKRETIIDVELTLAQKRYYRALYEKNVSALAAIQRASSTSGTDDAWSAEQQQLLTSSSSGSSASSMPTMTNLQMELRKCCNHPLLLRGVRDAELEKLQDELLQEQGREVVDAKSFRAQVGERLVIPQAGKMVLLDKLLPKLRKEGHRVLIFSQMVKMLSILAEFCQHRDYPYETLDGRVRGDERQRAIDRFNDPGQDSFVFLLSTRAGGVGVNLVAADTVIIYDSDWNPQNDVQAMARCHRLGQTRDVMVYRLVATRTFEGEMFDRASRKLGLERAVLSGDAFDDTGALAAKKNVQGPSASELEQLLRRGAYSLIENNDEAESRARAFCEADIEQILEEHATVRVVEGDKTAQWLNKSSFSVENQELSVNDPAFWEKAMPEMRTPELLLARLDRGFPLDKATMPVAATAGSKGGRLSLLSQEEVIEEVQIESALASCEAHEKTAADSTAEDDDAPVEIDEQLKQAFVSDLETLVAGAIKRRYRGTLSDNERQSTMQLLLKVSLDHAFTDKERAEATLWYKQLEGNRRRVKVTQQQQQQQQQRELIEDDDDDEELDDEDDDDVDVDDGDNDVEDEEGDEDEGKASKRLRCRRIRRRRDVDILAEQQLPSRRQHQKRRGTLRRPLVDDEDEGSQLDDDADPRSLLARVDLSSNDTSRKNKTDELPELPQAPPNDMIRGQVAKVVHFDGHYFYVARNDDTAGAVAGMLRIDATELVKLNRRRFAGLTKNARLMLHTCLELPDSFGKSAASTFNGSAPPPVIPRKPMERYQSYASATNVATSTPSTNRGADVVPYEVATKTPAVAIFTPTPGLCGACGGSDDIGTLVECRSCGIIVHCGCYGVDEEQFSNTQATSSASKRRGKSRSNKAKRNHWTCDVCSFEETDKDNEHESAQRSGVKRRRPSKPLSVVKKASTARPPCVLCSYRGGPMKRVDTGGWAHVHCATFVPEINFGNTATMSPVCDVNKVKAERYVSACILCTMAGPASRQGGGATVRCSRTGNATRCNAWFHPSCAFTAGCGLLITGDENGCSDKVTIIHYCPRHTPHFFPDPPPRFSILEPNCTAEIHDNGDDYTANMPPAKRVDNSSTAKKRRRASHRAASVGPDSAGDNGVYCICQQPSDPSDFYIQCDVCGIWLHPRCVGIDDQLASTLDVYCCPSCNQKGKQPPSRRSKRTRAWVEDDEEDGEDDDDYVDDAVPQIIEPERHCICNRPEADGDFFVGCDDCGRWFHPACVGLDPTNAQAIESFTCPECVKKKGAPPRRSRRTKSA